MFIRARQLTFPCVVALERAVLCCSEEICGKLLRNFS